MSRPRILRSAPLGLAIVALALASCRAVPPAPIDPDARATALVARRLDDPGLRAFALAALGAQLPAADAAWSADALVAAAWYFHPRIAQAAAAADAAGAAVQTARALPNPTLSVSPEYSVNPARGESPWSPSVQLEWPIPTAGKRSRALDRATAEALAAHYALAGELADAARDVRLAFAELRAAEISARAGAEEARAAAELADAWRKRVSLGAASRAEASPAELDALAAASVAAAAHARAGAARTALASAIGVTDAALPPLVDAAASQAPSDPPDARAALATRADVLAALARYAASEAALQGEIAKQFPDLRIGSGYQWDQGQSKFLLGLSLDLPVMDRNQGPIAEAIAARAQAAAEFDAVQTAAAGEIASAASAREAASAQAEALAAGAADLADAAARADAALAAGAASRLDALAARVAALRAERERADAEQAASAAEVRLAHALAPARADAEAIVSARRAQRGEN